jgi:hypothetical protein
MSPTIVAFSPSADVASPRDHSLEGTKEADTDFVCGKSVPAVLAAQLRR